MPSSKTEYKLCYNCFGFAPLWLTQFELCLQYDSRGLRFLGVHSLGSTKNINKQIENSHE